MSEADYINDNLFDDYITDMDNNNSLDNDETYPDDYSQVSFRRITKNDIMNLEWDLPKCVYANSVIMLRRAKLKQYKCEGLWYDGVICKILHVTKKAILFQIDDDEVDKEYKFWVPRIALRWLPNEKRILYIKHWINLEIYKEYNDKD